MVKKELNTLTLLKYDPITNKTTCIKIILQQKYKVFFSNVTQHVRYFLTVDVECIINSRRSIKEVSVSANLHSELLPPPSAGRRGTLNLLNYCNLSCSN